MTYYRIHSADESPETVLAARDCLGRELDPDRVDALLEAWS